MAKQAFTPGWRGGKCEYEKMEQKRHSRKRTPCEQSLEAEKMRKQEIQCGRSMAEEGAEAA
jgi:predicted alpha/beta-hydrolase family hydrolase